jgi:hypothetical protein
MSRNTMEKSQSGAVHHLKKVPLAIFKYFKDDIGNDLLPVYI